MSKIVIFLLTSFALAHKRFTKQVRENILGYFWALLIPAIYAVFFLMVKRSLSNVNAELLSYQESALRAFIGLSLIQLWFQIIQDVAQIVRANKGILRALTVDISPFLAALLFESIFALLIRLIIIVCALLYFHISFVHICSNIFFIVASFLTLLSTAFFFGVLLAPWASLFSDVRKFLSSSLMPVALLSPIFYPPVDTAETFLFWVNHINPFASTVAVLTNTLLNREPIMVQVMFSWLGVSMFSLVFLLRLLKRQIPVLLERMGS